MLSLLLVIYLYAFFERLALEDHLLVPVVVHVSIIKESIHDHVLKFLERTRSVIRLQQCLVFLRIEHHLSWWLDGFHYDIDGQEIPEVGNLVVLGDT